MNPTNRFSIEAHAGPYEFWPSRSGLIVDGTPSHLKVKGYVLLYQFETASGFLLVTDYDCPFEVAVNFVLVSKDLRKVLAERTVGAMYSTFLLENVAWTDERHFAATFIGVEGKWAFKIRDWSMPVIFPRLKMTYVATADKTDRRRGACR
jgi:hypothetical protein